MKHCNVHFSPDNLSTSIHAGATLLEAAGQAGLILSAPCGGIGRCGKCLVRLLPSEKEVRTCQYIVQHDLTVFVPDSSKYFKQKILEHGIEQKVDGDSLIRKVFLKDPPSQIKTLCESLSEKVSAQITVQNIPEATVSTQLQSFRESGLTVILFFNNDPENSPEYRLMGLEPGNTTDKLFGAAIDIGTTTVVASLADLNTGQILAVSSDSNPQGQYGADVISRISHCENESGPEELHTTIIACLNNLLDSVVQKTNISNKDIYEITIVGNTTMNHLLLRRPVQQLGQAPYRAHSLEASNHCPGELGLNINPSGNIHILANIAGFIGSDTLASALACGLETSKVTTLLVDIGTNGEIVLATDAELLAASCAAGPALEGAGIICGSRAQSGAIERVFLDQDDIDVDVIGSGQPHTLCGSGLIDAVAVMLELGIIDSTGRFSERYELDPMLSGLIRRRLINHNAEPAFVLAGQYSGDKWESAIFLTQKDIRQIQLAKAAIRAGIELLIKHAGTNIENIQQLLLAGAFGNYIQKKSAVRIGLLPSIPLEKIRFVGNAAGSGARMALISQNTRKTAKITAEKINYVEIAHQADFQMVFSEFLLFPEN